MRRLPPEPQVGERITAELVRELIRCIRERQLLKGPNYTLQTGPNGTYLKIDPSKNAAAKFVDNGCWKIVSGTREEDGENEGETVEKPVRIFANQFYIVGNFMFETDVKNENNQACAVEDFVLKGDLNEGEEYTAEDKPFVALKIPATTDQNAQEGEDPGSNASLEGYASVADILADAKDPAFILRPLYKLTHFGDIAVDLRNCPSLQSFEVLS